MKQGLIILAIAISFFMNSISWAEEESRAESGPSGVAFSLLGDPGLTLIGVNYLHALSDVTRFRAGIGTLFD